MIVKFNSLNRVDKPLLTLCNPGSKPEDVEDGSPFALTNVVGILCDHEAEELVLNFNALSELNFRVNKIRRDDEGENKHVLDLYKKIQNRRLIFVENIGYFMITEVSDGCEDGTAFKDVRAQSADVEIQQKLIPYIGDGTYKFEDLIRKIVEVLPLWTIDTENDVDEGVKEKYRTFEDVDVSKNCLDFLLNDIQDAYECIVLFDITYRRIKVFDQANYVEETPIYLTKDDVIQHIDIKENSEDLYTAVNVRSSEEDVVISPINPTGGSVIYNFDYYLDWMPERLRDRVVAWQNAIKDNRERYAQVSLSYHRDLTRAYELELEIERLNTQIDLCKRCMDNIVVQTTTDGIKQVVNSFVDTICDVIGVASKQDWSKYEGFSEILGGFAGIVVSEVADHATGLIANLLGSAVGASITIGQQVADLNGYEAQKLCAIASLEVMKKSLKIKEWYLSNYPLVPYSHTDIDSGDGAIMPYLGGNGDSIIGLQMLGSIYVKKGDKLRATIVVKKSDNEEYDVEYPLSITSVAKYNAIGNEVTEDSFELSDNTDGQAEYAITDEQTRSVVMGFAVSDDETESISLDSNYSLRIYYSSPSDLTQQEIDEVEKQMNALLALETYEEETTSGSNGESLISQYSSSIAKYIKDIVTGKKNILDVIKDVIVSINDAIKIILKAIFGKDDYNITEGFISEHKYSALSMHSYFTLEEYAELSNYIFEGDYRDEYVIITDSMSLEEQYEQMKEMYDRAERQLNKASEPTREFNIDVDDFIFSKSFQHWSQYLKTGCLINVELDDNDIAKLFLSRITINYDDRTLNLTFGNRYNKYDTKSLFDNVLGKIEQSANSLNIVKDTIYPIKRGELNEVKKALASSRSLSMANALSSSSEEVIIDDSGYLGRRLSTDSEGTKQYDYRQIKITGNSIVFTQDGWESCDVAIGEIGTDNGGDPVYGINAKNIIGDMMVGNNLIIKNSDGTDLFQAIDDKVVMTMQDATSNGFITSTGYTFSGDGLVISRWDNDVSNKLDNTGMYVSRNDITVLMANDKGVTTSDLTARRTLKIGTNSRFVDYRLGDDSCRTACYWTGNSEAWICGMANITGADRNYNGYIRVGLKTVDTSGVFYFTSGYGVRVVYRDNNGDVEVSDGISGGNKCAAGIVTIELDYSTIGDSLQDKDLSIQYRTSDMVDWAPIAGSNFKIEFK